MCMGGSGERVVRSGERVGGSVEGGWVVRGSTEWVCSVGYDPGGRGWAWGMELSLMALGEWVVRGFGAFGDVHCCRG